MDDVFRKLFLNLKKSGWFLKQIHLTGFVVTPWLTNRFEGKLRALKSIPDPHHANCSREFPAVGDSVAAWKPKKKTCSFLRMFISTHWITKRNPALERPELWQSKLKSGTNQHCNETWMRSFVSQEFRKKCEETRTNVSHDVLVLYPGLQKNWMLYVQNTSKEHPQTESHSPLGNPNCPTAITTSSSGAHGKTGEVRTVKDSPSHQCSAVL